MLPPFATTGGMSGAQLKAASRNTALFITPGITPKFPPSRRPMGHSAPLHSAGHWVGLKDRWADSPEIWLGISPKPTRCNVRSGSMLSKKSPRTICRITIRNNRIGANGFLTRDCAFAPGLESIFRARQSKIVFRQRAPRGDQSRRRASYLHGSRNGAGRRRGPQPGTPR